MPQVIAVVHDAHGVCFVATAHCQHDVETQVVDYIRERLDYVLWPRAAAHFANVGQRWDPERLELVDGDAAANERRLTIAC